MVGGDVVTVMMMYRAVAHHPVVGGRSCILTRAWLCDFHVKFASRQLTAGTGNTGKGPCDLSCSMNMRPEELRSLSPYCCD